MADTLEPQNLRERLFAPLGTGRLRHTPLRDLLRGRITGRLDWRGRINAADLPAPIAELVMLVVKRTRLWRLEKAAVADELITHFADGLASGESVTHLVNDFGDAKTAATLIRRAKRRNRPLAWQALKWTRRGLLLLATLYGVVFIRFLAGRSHVTVDYVAQLNTKALSTPIDQRAWPLYRAAILSMKLDEAGVKTPENDVADPDGDDPLKKVIETRPGETGWPRMVQWLRDHQADLNTVRAAAAKPAFGFVLGRSGDSEDGALNWTRFARDAQGNQLPMDAVWESGLMANSVVEVLLPYLASLNGVSDLLRADARDAADQQDGVRLFDDLIALRGMAAQLRSSLVIDQFVSIRIDGVMLDALAATLRDQPALLYDAHLISLAHQLAQMGGDTSSTVLNFDGERASFKDMLQRLFTDDGHGDGRLSHDGAAILPMLSGTVEKQNGWQGAVVLSGIGLGSTTNTRRQNLDEYNRLLDMDERRAARPLYEIVNTDDDLAPERRMGEIERSSIDSVRLLPVRIFTPGLSRASEQVERFLGRRDGVEVGIALELYRRHHDGQLPSSLDELTPQWLPRVPFDRIDGTPLKYRVIDGKPVIYSVGVDGDDDGGRAGLDRYRNQQPDPTWAAHWHHAGEKPTDIDGDWIVFDARPQPSKMKTH